jgi:hypothetical protein
VFLKIKIKTRERVLTVATKVMQGSFFLGFRLLFPRSCGPFIKFNAPAKQPEPGFEVVESFRPGYPRRQMAFRGLASHGLIRRPAFSLPKTHQSRRSKERKERRK